MRRAVEFTPGFCILWSLLLLSVPLRWILAAMGAAVFHELCHWTAIRFSGGQVHGLILRAAGMVMETDPMLPGRELVCALAGPAGSFLLAILYEYTPLLSLCGLVQGCFNLLPLYPLDGGRAVRCLLEMAGRERWLAPIEYAALLLLLVPAVKTGTPGLAAWTLAAFRKIPCKHWRFGVQ